MNSLFFLAMLIAIAWLAVWAVLPRPWQGGGWWPFDMREPPGEADAAPAPRRGRIAPRRRPLPPTRVRH